MRSGCLSHVPHADTVRRERNVPHEPITALHTCVRALSIGRESGVCGGEESGRREATAYGLREGADWAGWG